MAQFVFYLSLSSNVCSAAENRDTKGNWRERIKVWNDILRKEKLAEQLDSLNARYVVEFDMEEVKNSLRKDVVEKTSETQGTRALWISKRWWRYRPKLPYTYFLQKLDSSEVKKNLPLPLVFTTLSSQVNIHGTSRKFYLSFEASNILWIVTWGLLAL